MSPPLENCPRCGSQTEHLVPVGVGTRSAILAADPGASVPEKICPSCLDSLGAEVSQGAKLRMERDMREKNKMMMWKNRVQLIKQARGLMGAKAYSEAAVKYEKYLRVLELVYNLKKGELGPNVFNNSSRSKELTIVTSVYWDLVRIYDTNPRYSDRMQNSAAKLAEFLPFSQIYPDVVKKAEIFLKSAKNPNVIRSLLRSSKSKRGGCFIATAAFADTPYAVELTVLRRYRDQVLRPSLVGRRLIWLYYRVSPPLASWLTKHPHAQTLTKGILTKISQQVHKSLN